MYESGRPTAANLEAMRKQLILRLSKGKNCDWLHPNFYYEHIYPIGITWSHAFVVSYTKEDRHYRLHALDLHPEGGNIDTPYEAMRENRQFSNPWKKWPGQLKTVQAACCYLGRVCVVTKTHIFVLDASKDWEIVVNLNSNDFRQIQGCSMNHRYLAFYYNNQTDKTSKLCVYSMESKQIAPTNVNNVQVTGIYVPEELTEAVASDVYVGFCKYDAVGQLQDTPTCVFHVTSSGLELELKKRFVAWPEDDQRRPLASNGPELIQYRLGTFLQAADRHLICFFSAGNANNLFLPAAAKIIHAQPISDSAIVVFQGNNSLLLSDGSLGVNLCIEPSELCEPAAIASFARFRGVPEYTRCYSAFRVMSNRIVILLPNGSLCSVYPVSQLRIQQAEAASSSSSFSSNLASAPIQDDE